MPRPKPLPVARRRTSPVEQEDYFNYKTFRREEPTRPERREQRTQPHRREERTGPERREQRTQPGHRQQRTQPHRREERTQPSHRQQRTPPHRLDPKDQGTRPHSLEAHFQPPKYYAQLRADRRAARPGATHADRTAACPRRFEDRPPRTAEHSCSASCPIPKQRRPTVQQRLAVDRDVPYPTTPYYKKPNTVSGWVDAQAKFTPKYSEGRGSYRKFAVKHSAVSSVFDYLKALGNCLVCGCVRSGAPKGL